MDVDLDKVGLYHCKRCSKCGFVHAPPFKSRCRYLLGIELPEGILPADTVATDATGAMACLGGSGFTDPEDPEYHAWCEAQARERAYDKEINSRVLQQIMNRLDRLELQPKAIPPSPSLQPAAPGFQPTLAGSTAGPPGGRSAPAGLLGHQPPAGLLGQHSTGPPPPSAMVSEVTDALSRISVAIDPSGSEVKGITLRPEYWVQHDRQGVPVRALNHARLTIPELMYGMFRVMSAVTDPSQKAAYEAHYKFLSECIIQDLYPARAYVNYDREVTNKIINGELSEYPACDLPSFALQLRKDKEKPQTRPYYRGNKRCDTLGTYRQDTSSSRSPMPEDWPNDICYNWNVNSCFGRCVKLHVCVNCRYRHKMS